MLLPDNPYTFPALVVALIALFLGVFMARRYNSPGAKSSALLMFAVATWAFGYGFELASADLADVLTYVRVEYVGIVIVPMAWFAFALEYTGRERFLSRRNLTLLSIPPFGVLLLAWTNEWHGLFWSRLALSRVAGYAMFDPVHGLGFWAHTAYSYVLILASTILLLRALVRSDHLYRKQAAALVIATLAPWIGNAWYLSGLSPFPHLDLTPFAFTVSGAALAWGLFRYRLLDIVPIARETVLKSLSDAVLVLDAQNRVVDANPAAMLLFGKTTAECIGQPAGAVFASHADLIDRYREAKEARTELASGTGIAQRYYDLRISPLDAGDHRPVAGRLVVIRDITERRRGEQALRDLNEELEARVAVRTAALDLELTERKRIEQENRRRVDQLESLRQIGLEITSQLDLPAVLKAIGQRVVKLMGALTCSFYLYRPDRNEIERVAFTGPRLVASAETRKRGEGLIGKVWESGNPIFVNDYQSWSQRNVQYDGCPSRNVMGVPLVWGDEFLGVANVVADAARPFADADVDFMKTLAMQAATAIRNAQLFAAAQQEIAERKQAEEALVQANRQLEERVRERTAGLERTNRALEQEIAERTRVEDELAAQRDFALQVMNTMGQGLTVTDADRCFEFVNPAYARMVGRPAAQLIGKRPHDVTALCDYATLDQARAQRLQGRVTSYETRFQHADGHMVHVLITGVPRWQDNRVAGTIAVVTDLTERRQAEEQIKELNRDLERRVDERTRQLAETVERLRAQVAERERAEQRLLRQSESERLVSEISTRFINAELQGIPAAIQHALELVGRFVGADRSHVLTVSPDRTVWKNTHEWYADGGSGEIQDRQGISADSLPWWNAKILAMETIHIPCVADLPAEASAEKKLLQAQAIQSALVVPMVYGQAVVGCIGLDAVQTARTWSEEEIRLLRLVADILVNVLGRERVEEAEREQRQLAEAFRDTAASLNNTLDSDVVLDQILESVKRVVPHDAATIMLIAGETARVVRSRGYAEREEASALKAWRAAFATTPGLREMSATGAPHIIPNIDACADWDHSWPTQWEHSFVGVPIQSQGQVIGFLNLYAQQPEYYAPIHAQRLQAFADQVSIALTNARLFDDVQRHLEHVEALHTIDRAISSSFDLRVTLEVVLDQVTRQLGVDAAAVSLLNVHSQMLLYAATRGVRAGALQHSQWRLGAGYAGRAALERRTVGVRAVDGEIDEAVIAPALRSEGFVTYLATPLMAKGQVKGVLEVYHRTRLDPDATWVDFFETLAGQTAIAVDNADLFGDLQRSHSELSLAYDATLAGWSHALELRDRETDGHSQRVTEMTERLAREMGIRESDIVHIRRGALLHDIGKMGVPDSILLKPGPLTDDEREIMKRHATHAYELLMPISYLRPVIEIPYSHHERWDGTGYPLGLKGEEIPLAARIFAVVDVWDALASDRPYRAAWPLDRVLDHIRQGSGSHFDPKVVDVFLASLSSQ